MLIIYKTIFVFSIMVFLYILMSYFDYKNKIKIVNEINDHIMSFSNSFEDAEEKFDDYINLLKESLNDKYGSEVEVNSVEKCSNFIDIKYTMNTSEEKSNIEIELGKVV